MMLLFSLFIVFSISMTISGNDDYAAFSVETRLLCHGEAYSGASVAFYKRDLPVSDLCYVTTSNETGKVAAHVQMDFPQKFGGGMCRRSSLSDYQISLFTCVYHGGDCDEDGEV
ncbi:hypothetical protein M3Y95_00873300 [Aphelenchoides besseyi]|nr:hypothetical protein M3Y95_00873300 [Aphelenchoides besseyi]